MQRRYLIVALALVVALVAITPTLGSTAGQKVIDKSTFPVRTAKKAKAIAKRAKQIANEANATAAAAQQTASNAVDTANQAKSDAAAAQSTANGAVTTANTAKTTADATASELAGLRAKSATVAGSVTTPEENAFVDLGGPTVSLTVPPSGLIEVTVQARIDDDGALALFEDGQQVPGQDPNDFCQTFGGLSPLLANDAGGAGPLVLSTGSITFACGSVGPPVPVMFKTSPGQHTYDLRYADCGCTPGTDAEISNRTLTVAPRP
jgi:hypothetical protein